MDAIAMIAGTGRWWNADYKNDMKDSFCSQIFDLFAGAKDLQRGPSDDGIRFNDKAEAAVRSIAAAKDAGADRLFLAGYSRGAAIALKAAVTLDSLNIQVDGLFLFDPVVRLPSRRSVEYLKIPANVVMSRTAHRDLNPALVAKYEGAFLQKPYNLLPLATRREAVILEKIPYVNRIAWLGNPIRPEFGRFVLTPAGPGDHRVKRFHGSHGALGGVGWKSVPEDEKCQPAIAAWMNMAFAACSLDVRVVARKPTAVFEMD